MSSDSGESMQQNISHGPLRPQAQKKLFFLKKKKKNKSQTSQGSLLTSTKLLQSDTESIPQCGMPSFTAENQRDLVWEEKANVGAVLLNMYTAYPSHLQRKTINISKDPIHLGHSFCFLVIGEDITTIKRLIVVVFHFFAVILCISVSLGVLIFEGVGGPVVLYVHVSHKNCTESCIKIHS